MSLRKQLKEAALNVLQEGTDSSKEILTQNIVNSFDEMGMATTNPGEFSQEEITDKNNLTNVSAMSNDTDFEGKIENPQANEAEDILDVGTDLMHTLVDISDKCDKCDDEDKKAELHILEFGESSMSKIIDKVLSGKTCEQFLHSLTESDYAGPRDWNPDTRINVANVLTTLKREIGKGSEGIHVDQVYDDQHNDAYKVSQIDKNLLPKELKVETIVLKLGDDNIYYKDKMSNTYPLPK